MRIWLKWGKNTVHEDLTAICIVDSIVLAWQQYRRNSLLRFHGNYFNTLFKGVIFLAEQYKLNSLLRFHGNSFNTLFKGDIF